MLEGRDAIVRWLCGRAGATPAEIAGPEHHGHHPEIDAHQRDRGRGHGGTLQDRGIVPVADVEISGTALDPDSHRRTDAGWCISHTGYKRVFEQYLHSQAPSRVRSFTSRFSPGGLSPQGRLVRG